MVFLQTLFLVLILFSVGFLVLRPLEKYANVKEKNKSKLDFEGTNRQTTGFNVNLLLEDKFSKWFPEKTKLYLKRANYESFGELILIYLLVIVLTLIIELVIFWFFFEYWFLMIPVAFLLVVPVAHIIGKLQEHEKDLLSQAPHFTSVIIREFSRYNNMEIAFRRAAAETKGWTRIVFTKMCDYLKAVEGDIDGALNIFNELHGHQITDQFVIAIKQGMSTNKVHEGLVNVSRNAMHEKKLMEIREMKKSDGIIFLNVTVLVMILFADFAYIILNTVGNSIFNF